MDGGIIGVLHTDIDVLAWVGWGCMGVTMNVGQDLSAGQALWVQWDVAIDQASVPMGALDLIESCTRVDMHGEVVVVTQDQTLMAVKVTHEPDELRLLVAGSGHGDITQVPDMVAGFDNHVPRIVHELVGILGTVPARANSGTVLLQEPVHVVMPESAYPR